jgi:hypothetical protein
VRFLYGYIFGDDWTVAVAVIVGLFMTFVLDAYHLVAWWLVPVIVIVMTGVSLRRSRGS